MRELLLHTGERWSKRIKKDENTQNFADSDECVSTPKAKGRLELDGK